MEDYITPELLMDDCCDEVLNHDQHDTKVTDVQMVTTLLSPQNDHVENSGMQEEVLDEAISSVMLV